jgi:ribosomal protein S8
MKITQIQSVLKNFLQGTRSRKVRIIVNNSKEISSILDILMNYGFILGYSKEVNENYRTRINIFPRYKQNGSAFLNEIYFYKDYRVYCSYDKLLMLSKRIGPSILLVYTSHAGIISHDIALSKGFGGVLLCKLD